MSKGHAASFAVLASITAKLCFTSLSISKRSWPSGHRANGSLVPRGTRRSQLAIPQNWVIPAYVKFLLLLTGGEADGGSLHEARRSRRKLGSHPRPRKSLPNSWSRNVVLKDRLGTVGAVGCSISSNASQICVQLRVADFSFLTWQVMSVAR